MRRILSEKSRRVIEVGMEDMGPWVVRDGAGKESGLGSRDAIFVILVVMMVRG